MIFRYILENKHALHDFAKIPSGTAKHGKEGGDEFKYKVEIFETWTARNIEFYTTT